MDLYRKRQRTPSTERPLYSPKDQEDRHQDDAENHKMHAHGQRRTLLDKGVGVSMLLHFAYGPIVREAEEVLRHEYDEDGYRCCNRGMRILNQ